jgi:UDP:flavonoid glycosyltransferase YjiC (YdhE family)
MRRFMSLRRGTERVIREWFLPSLRDSYEDTLAAAQGADLLVSHPLTYATRLVAEKEGLPWVSTMPTPAGFFSAYSPPLLPGCPEVTKALRFLGPAFWGPFGRSLAWVAKYWARPWYRFRRELGLPPADHRNPLVEGFSPRLHLAPFSRWLAPMQPDWPPQTAITGFPFLDRDHDGRLSADLARFLDDGPAPIVFTLGSSAAAIAGRYYEQSAEAARQLGQRAVLILGAPRTQPPTLPIEVVAFEYAPFAALFARAAAVVFPGGIGTTGLALRAGLPMLVVPLAHDQPDTADRLKRLGVARTLEWRRYSAPRAAAELKPLLEDPAYRKRADQLSACVRQEDGIGNACDAIKKSMVD